MSLSSRPCDNFYSDILFPSNSYLLRKTPVSPALLCCTTSFSKHAVISLNIILALMAGPSIIFLSKPQFICSLSPTPLLHSQESQLSRVSLPPSTTTLSLNSWHVTKPCGWFPNPHLTGAVDLSLCLKTLYHSVQGDALFFSPLDWLYLFWFLFCFLFSPCPLSDKELHLWSSVLWVTCYIILVKTHDTGAA